MTDQQLFCDGPGEEPGEQCDRPVAGHGKGKCPAHLKQLQRRRRCVPIAAKLNPEERAVVAGTAMLEADSDEEYETRRRAFIAACKALGGNSEWMGTELGRLADEARRRRSLEVKNGLAAARARGARLGRPPKVDAAELERLFERLKSARLVAVALAVSVRTVNRRLRAGQKPNDFGRAVAGPRHAR